VVVSVGKTHERSGEDVVGEHLRIVFALLLNVDYEDLLDPEAPLNEVVPLEQAVGFAKGPAFPDAMEVEPEVRVVHDVHAQRPGPGVVDDQPRLLLESVEALLRPDAAEPSKRIQQVVHNCDPQACEDDCPEYHKRQVVGAAAVHVGLGVVVRHVEEFGGAAAGAGKEHVREREEHEEVDRDAWTRSQFRLMSTS
jgi:hypothetical protein